MQPENLESLRYRIPMLLFTSRPTGLGLDRYSRCVNRRVKNLSVAFNKDELMAGTIKMSETH